MLSKILKTLRLAESTLLVALFLILLLVAVAQIIARNVFSGGILWGDDLVRMGVLWITMVGGMVATGEDGHIRIDLVQRVANDFWIRITRTVTNIGASAICLLVAYASVKFVHWEFLDARPGVGAIPAWIFVSMIPFAMFVMGVRYLIQVFVPVRSS